MKKIKFTLTCIMLLTSLLSIGQITQMNAPYVGTWEHQNGNQIFRLIIWQDSAPNPINGTKYLVGHYELVDTSNGTPQIIYTSNPPELPTQKKLSYAFSGTVHQQSDTSMTFGGTFKQIHSQGGGIRGDFAIRLIPTCSTCPKKIHWSVAKKAELRVISEGQVSATEIIVPTDIELTKI